MTSKSAQGVLAGKIWLAIFCKCEKVYQVGLSSGLSLLAWVLFASFLSASVIHLRFQRDVVLPSLHYVEGRFGTNIHYIHLFQFYIFRSISLFLCKFTKMGVVPSVGLTFPLSLPRSTTFDISYMNQYKLTDPTNLPCPWQPRYLRCRSFKPQSS